MVAGAGTLLDMATVLVGSGLGVALGGRLPERTRTTVTDAFGLVTLVIGALDVAALSDPAFRRAVGDSAPLLIVLGGLLPEALVSSVTVTGGVLLLGVGLRLLHVKAVAVGDVLPALVVAPVLTSLVHAVR